jgi:hypothetical protein
MQERADTEYPWRTFHTASLPSAGAIVPGGISAKPSRSDTKPTGVAFLRGPPTVWNQLIAGGVYAIRPVHIEIDLSELLSARI